MLAAIPSAEAKERRSPKLEGAKGGEGRNGVIGEGSFAPVPIGEGGFGTRDEIGESGGRAGNEGPAVLAESGEWWRREGDGECMDGDPEDIVGDLNGFSTGLRMGTGPAGAEGS